MSEKRTDLDTAGGEVAEWKDCAWVKSAEREGSFGCVRVDVVVGEEKPWNWDVRSSSCLCRGVRESVIARAALQSCQFFRPPIQNQILTITEAIARGCRERDNILFVTPLS